MAAHFSIDRTPADATDRGEGVDRLQSDAAGGAPDDCYVAAPYLTGGDAGRKGGGRGTSGRTTVVVISIVVAVFLIVGGSTAYALMNSANKVKAAASAVMSQVDVAKGAVQSGDGAALDNAVGVITQNSSIIKAETHSLPWQIASFFPFYGEDVRSVQKIGEVAEDLSLKVLEPISKQISGKKLTSIFHDGSFDTDLISSVCETVSGAMPSIRKDIETLSTLPDAHISQLSGILSKVKSSLSDVESNLDLIEKAVNVLPGMVGANGSKHSYLVIAQNNAELRALGGLPGSWGDLNVSNGVIDKGEFFSILHVDGVQVDMSGEELAASGGGNTDPAQVNNLADFSRVGEMAISYWQQLDYGTDDGVIAMDPVFLQWLLGLTGGVQLEDGTELNGDNCARVLMSDVYWRFGNDGESEDAYFSEAAEAAFNQVLSHIGEVDVKKLVDVIKKAANEGRLYMYMTDPNEEAFIEELGLAGKPESDVAKPQLGVYFYDQTISKISWYADTTTIVGDAVKNADGTNTYSVVTTFSNTITENEATTGAKYIIGMGDSARCLGDSVNWIILYSPLNGSISDFVIHGDALDTDSDIVETDLNGSHVIRAKFHVEPQQTATITYNVTVSSEATQALSVRTTPLAQEQFMD